MYIYIGRNLNSKKCYVGQSINDPWQERIKAHIEGRAGRSNPAICADIKKGDLFDWEIIHYPGASPAALNAIEEWHIAKNNAYTEGYNRTPRSRGGGKRSKATRQKISESKKLQYMDPVQRQKQSERTKGEKHPYWNINPEDHHFYRDELRSPEVIEYISRMRNLGYGVRYIARQLGEPRSTIRRIVRQLESN